MLYLSSHWNFDPQIPGAAWTEHSWHFSSWLEQKTGSAGERQIFLAGERQIFLAGQTTKCVDIFGSCLPTKMTEKVTKKWLKTPLEVMERRAQNDFMWVMLDKKVCLKRGGRKVVTGGTFTQRWHLSVRSEKSTDTSSQPLSCIIFTRHQHKLKLNKNGKSDIKINGKLHQHKWKRPHRKAQFTLVLAFSHVGQKGNSGLKIHHIWSLTFFSSAERRLW